ncbi:MAG: hypothetical protein CK424_01515 [Legionella sp.]|nr:MAG: hypothetical protein CK424_01515 [Legionella sp.]
MNIIKSIKKYYQLCIIVLAVYASPLHANPHPTLILIHGALFTSSVWSPIQNYLQSAGYQVVTVDTPGRLQDGIAPNDATLSAAVDKVCQVVALQSKPVILVGHNQAGAIITQATASCGSYIRGLIYLAAVVPWPGERPFDMLSDQDNKNFDLAAPLETKTGLSIPDTQAPIHQLFMSDADPAQAQQAIQTMVPEPIMFAYDILDYNLEAFHHIPKFYIKTLNDVMISPESQERFIQREPMNRVIELPTGHCPFISKPILMGKMLAEIADGL